MTRVGSTCTTLKEAAVVTVGEPFIFTTEESTMESQLNHEHARRFEAFEGRHSAKLTQTVEHEELDP